MADTTVFVTSHDPAVRDSVAELVESAGLHAKTFPSLQEFLDAVGPGTRGCLVFDAQIGDLSDVERWDQFAAACARIPVVLIVDRGHVSTSVRAMRAGAVDVVQKPLSDNNFLKKIKKAVAAGAAAQMEIPYLTT